MKRPVPALLITVGWLVTTPLFAQDAGTEPPVAGIDAGAQDAALTPPPRPDAEPVRPPTPVLADPEQHAVAKDVNVIVHPPFGWVGDTAESIATDDIEQVPGSKVEVSRVWRPSDERIPVRPKYAESARMQLLCVSAPSTDWAPGMESLVFERLNVTTRGELSKHMVVTTYGPAEINESGAVFWQNFTLRGNSGAARKEGSVRVLEADNLGAQRVVLGEGRHVIGFSSDPDHVLVCSLACVEPVGRRLGACTSALGTFRLDGQLAPEPTPSALGRLILGVKRRPSALIVSALGLLISLIGALAILRGLMLRAGARRSAPAG